MVFQRSEREEAEAGSLSKASEAPPIEDDTAEARAARRAWTRLIKRICEVDPLICPECSGPMRIISFIEEADAIGQILEHLKLRDELVFDGVLFCETGLHGAKLIRMFNAKGISCVDF